MYMYQNFGPAATYEHKIKQLKHTNSQTARSGGSDTCKPVANPIIKTTDKSTPSHLHDTTTFLKTESKYWGLIKVNNVFT